jgi:choline kinase
MKAIILSAGQGKRLLPMTAELPKCLLPVDSRPIIAWQIEALHRGGIDDIAVVTGFGARQVDKVLAELARPGLRLTPVFNPFYAVADNLASCWMVRERMREDFILLNGDTIFESQILARLLASPPAPITVTIDRKSLYDSDDMKVRVEDGRLVEIGKTLPLDLVTGESIGMLLFRGQGPGLFRRAVEEAMGEEHALRWWYLTVINRLAHLGEVRAALIEGLGWTEVDYLPDLTRARALVQQWRRGQAQHASRPLAASL